MILAIIMFIIGFLNFFQSSPVDRKKLPHWQRRRLAGLILLVASIPVGFASTIGPLMMGPRSDLLMAWLSTLLTAGAIIASVLLAFTEIGRKSSAPVLTPPTPLMGAALQSADEYIQRGSERATGNDYAGAIQDFDAAIALDAQNTTAYFLRGKAYLHFDRIKAANDFKKVLGLQPDHPQAATLRKFIRDAG